MFLFAAILSSLLLTGSGTTPSQLRKDFITQVTNGSVFTSIDRTARSTSCHQILANLINYWGGNPPALPTNLDVIVVFTADPKIREMPRPIDRYVPQPLQTFEFLGGPKFKWHIVLASINESDPKRSLVFDPFFYTREKSTYLRDWIKGFQAPKSGQSYFVLRMKARHFSLISPSKTFSGQGQISGDEGLVESIIGFAFNPNGPKKFRNAQKKDPSFGWNVQEGLGSLMAPSQNRARPPTNTSLVNSKALSPKN